MSAASITCPVCGATSWNPNDVEAGYCGRCRDFTGARDQPGLTPVLVRVVWGADASPRVLLQIASGHLVMTAASARQVAALLLNVADDLDEIS